nr:hypothetical protein [Tanacetum cinerariifolium]
PVTILNTLDPLGKFQGNVDEGFLVGYSVCSKAFRSVSPDFHSSSCGDQSKEQGDKAENKDKGKSFVVTITGFRDLNEDSNEVNVTGSLISAAGLNFTNNTNDFSVAGPSNAAMPNLEDLSHNADDVGAEADINNMESIISTRNMARGVRDQGGISQMFNKDFHTCMFACLHAFCHKRSPKESIKLSRIQVGLKPCKKSSFSLRCKKFGSW